MRYFALAILLPALFALEASAQGIVLERRLEETQRRPIEIAPRRGPIRLVEHKVNITIEEQYGGGGLTPLEVLLVSEEVGRVCPDSAHIVSKSSMGASQRWPWQM